MKKNLRNSLSVSCKVMKYSMMIITVVCSLSSMLMASTVNAQKLEDATVSLSADGKDISAILAEIETKTQLKFVYNPNHLKKDVIEGKIFKNEKVKLLLQKLGYAAREEGRSIIVTRLSSPQQPGRISGRIVDDKGEPLPGASIKLLELNKVVSSSVVDGTYQFSVPSGTYTIEVSYISFQTKRIADVIVKDGQVVKLDVVLKMSTSSLNEVVVKSSYKKESIAGLYVQQKNNASMTDGISAEQISSTPDNNAGQVLKRVSGIVVQENKFVTIRGVSDRYNNVSINGAILPSTEPNRRNFSFDVIPSSLIENIIINKTASPDMTSEFTGGLVQVKTRDIPDKNFIDFTMGTGINTVSYGKTVKDHKRLFTDYLGAKGSEREWFQQIMKPGEYQLAVYNNDREYMAKVGSEIPNRWRYYNYNIQPVQNYQLSAGLVKLLKNDATIGITTALTYRNEQTVEEGEKNNLAVSSYTTTRSTFYTALGGLLNASLKLKRHRISFKNLYNRKFNSQFDEDYGLNYGSMGEFPVNRTISNILITQLVQHRLEGEHAIGRGNIKIEWFADKNTLDRNQPDTRYILGQKFNEFYSYNFKEATIEWGALYASALKEERKNAGLNVTVPFKLFKTNQSIKTGYFYSDRDAEFNGSAFRTADRTEAWYTKQAGLPFYLIATQQNFADQRLEYKPVYVKNGLSTGDGYQGNQKLDGGYVMADLKLFRALRLTGGMRYEANRMTVGTKYYNTVGTDTLETGNNPLEESWLPSANFIYSITPKFNARIAYSKTLARPDFVERSPFVYYDFAENLLVWGLEGLKTTHIKNYDFRLEYYPSPGEIITASVFYKDLTDPVERFFVFGSSSNAVVYNNLDKGKVRGIEVDFRKSLGFISPWPMLNKLFINGNFSYIKGRIETIDKTTGEVIQNNRPVQGLAPYSVNGGISYQGDIGGITLSYNRFGRRIIYGGTADWGIQYENPRDVLDLQLNAPLLKKKLDVRFNLSDLLAQPYIVYSNAIVKDGQSVGNLNDGPKGQAYDEGIDLINYKAKRGRNISLTLTYKF